MMTDTTRRRFLASAPLAAAAASLALTNKAALGEAAAAPAPAAEPVKVFTAAELAEDRKKLDAAQGNNVLYTSDNLPVAVTLTTEKAKAAKEFEWHEGRDHVIQILEGETIYELGGTPKGGHNTKPGEWLAPESEGAMKYTMKAGDMVVIPRNTPHKRTTPKSVTLYLIATTGK
jgi:quercetin dioxygenase-like cupin family protein